MQSAEISTPHSTGSWTRPENLQQFVEQMGLSARQNESAANAQQLQMQRIGKLLKDWGLLPKNHVLDEKILLSVLDKDSDNAFSFDDFVKNFPSFDRKQVAKFQVRQEMSDSAVTEESSEMESMSSLDSEVAQRQIDEFERKRKLKRTQMRSFLKQKLKSEDTMVQIRNDKVSFDLLAHRQNMQNARLQLQVEKELDKLQRTNSIVRYVKTKVEKDRLISLGDAAKQNHKGKKDQTQF